MTSARTSQRRAALTAAALTGVLVLAACGGESGGSGKAGRSQSGASAPASAVSGASAPASEAGGAHNSADVSFAQMMIPHHRQAVEMAGLAGTRASSEKVRELAKKIKEAQDPEIATMSSWLTKWGKKIPSANDMAHMEGMHHGGSGGMHGTAGSEEMRKLRKASGAAFDTAFLDMMIKHHEGAVRTAETEKAKGGYGPARDLAADIIRTQSAEITQMNSLLRKG